MNTPFPKHRQPLSGQTDHAVQGERSTSVRSGDPERMSLEERAVGAVWGRSGQARFGGVAKRLGRGDDPTIALPGTANPLGVAGRIGESTSEG